MRRDGRSIGDVYRLVFARGLPVGYVNYKGRVRAVFGNGNGGLYLDESDRWVIPRAHPLRPKTRGDA